MALNDIKMVRTDLELAELAIRKDARDVLSACNDFLRTAKREIEKNGKDAIAGQLGDDASEFATAYDNVKALYEEHTDQTVPALSELDKVE